MINTVLISPLRRILRNCSRVQSGPSRRRRLQRRQAGPEALEPRALLSAVAWDGGASTLNWSDAANWDTDAVPGANDDVTIDIVGENTINVAGTFVVGSFSSQESIYINGGQLTTNGSSTVAGNFGMRANTTFTVDGVGSVFTAPVTTHWELGNLTARNGAVIDLSAAISASNGFDGAGTTWRATGAASRIDLSGLAQFSGYGRNGQLVITATDGGTIDLSGAATIPGGTTQMSAIGTASLIDISAVESWVDGNRQRSSTVTWGDGGTIDVSGLTSLIGIGATATNGNVMNFPAVTRIGGNGDSTSNSRAEGTGSRLEFPAATTMDGPDRHGENAFRAIDGGVISMPAVTEIPGGTNRLEAFGAGSEIDVSALTYWNDTNFARSSNVSWGDGGIVRVDSLETLRGVGVAASNGNVLTFPAVTQISGGGDSSSSTVADGANSRIDFPVLAAMQGPERHGENSFRAINGGVISMPVLTVNTRGTTRMEAIGVGSEIDVSSMTSWTDNNRQRTSNLRWGDGGIVKVDSLETLNSVGVTATAGNVMTFPALTRIGGVGDSTGIHRADGEGSRLEYPAVTVVDGPDRHGDTSFRAENGGFIDLPVLTSVEHGAVSVSAFDTDGNGIGSEISVPLLASWNNNNRYRDSAIRYGRGGNIDFAALTTMTGVSVYSNTGDTVRLPALTTYTRSGNGAPRFLAENLSSRLEFPVLTSIEGATVNGRFEVYAFEEGVIELSSLISITGGPLAVLSRDAGSNILLSSLQTWTLDGRQPITSLARASVGGQLELGENTTISAVPVQVYAGSTLTVGTLELLSDASLTGTGTVAGNLLNTAGLVSPGETIGSLRIEGDFENAANGTVQIQLEGTIAGTNHDQLEVTGTATLDGTLNLQLTTGFEAVDGDQFTLLEFGDRICDFHTKAGTDLGNELHVAAAFDSTTMTLNTGATPDSGQQCTTPPEITIQSSSVVASEGDIAQNAGTFFDLEGPAVVVTSNVGTIVQDDPTGTWTWSFDTLDGPDDSQTVTITATDSDGDETSATFMMTVNNVAPKVDTDSALVTANEGSVASNSGTFGDVAQDTVSISASAGAVTQDDVLGRWSWSFDTLDGPDESQTVTITAIDSDGAVTETNFDLDVDNVAPTVAATLPIVNVNEGSVASNSGTFADAGQDTIVMTASVGTLTQDDVAGTWSWSFDTLDGPDDSQTVTVTATDSDGAVTETTFALTVENVAPTVVADSTAMTVDEGSVAANSGTFADAGQDTVSITASVGTVTQDDVDGTWSWSFNTLDGPDDAQTVTIMATDSDGAVTETTFALTVENVAPTVVAGSAAMTVDEGSVAANSGTFADVGEDTVAITVSVGTVIQDDIAGTWSWSFDTLDGPDNSQTVTITATDSDGAVTETTFALTVENVAPTVSSDSGGITVDEGAVASNTGTFADAGQDTVSISASVGMVTRDDVAGTWNWSFDTLDGPDDSQTVTITATDSDGAVTETTFALAVDNVAPTVGANSAAVSVGEGAVASNTGTFADAGQDIVSISASVGLVTQDDVAGTWNWSFDTLDGPDDSQTVTITATDSDGAMTATTFGLVVENVAPAASLDGPADGASGNSFVVTATTQDAAGALDPLVLLWNVALDGQPFETQNGGDSYTLNDATSGIYTFTLTVDDGDGGVTSATHTLAITADNQPPQLVISGPTQVVRGHSRTFTFSASDADIADDNGPFEYTIDWGDGSAVEIVTGGPELLIDHTFLTLTDSSGLLISATASDSGQLVSPTQQMVTHVTRWDVIADPLDASQTLLVIGGGLGDDFIKIRERRDDGRMRFRIHECDTGFVSHDVTDQAIDRVLVYGQGGDDWIHVAQNVDAPTMLDGGDGDDTLVGGRGQSILLGQAGNDWLFGGYGRGLLIGGKGADRIFGWNRSDILIGGYTSFDNDLRSLDLIMQEWTSDRSYSKRTSNLMGTGTGPRSNGTAFLRATSSVASPVTVFDDAAEDRLWGFRGADWYFANVSGSGIIDRVFGERWWEVVTDLDRE